MNTRSLRVMIIGAGPGGLCLAQGLVADGVEVDVFERDASAAERVQGYRLGINATGSRALRDCLPKARFDRLVASSANPSQGVTFLDHRLKRLLGIDFPGGAAAAEQNDRPVSRNVLRGILLEGVEHCVHFGKKFVAFEGAPGSDVTARFEDGSAATADVLVGADGASSRLRGQLLPHARRVETGISIVTGKFALSADVRARTPAAIWRGPTLVLGPDGRFLFANAVEYPHAPAASSPAGVVAQGGSGLASEREEYVMWGFSTWTEAFRARSPLETLSGAELQRVVLALMESWHPKLRQLVQSAEPPTISAFRARTAVPLAPWETRNVTLLGDALHNMTPYRGVGANTALQGAARLRRALTDVAHGRDTLVPALARYERSMLDDGFQAVRASLQEMQRLHSRSTLARLLTKTLFRAADRVQPLQSLFHAGR